MPTAFPRLCSLYCCNVNDLKFIRDLIRHITLLDVSRSIWRMTGAVLELSQFPQLRTLVIETIQPRLHFKIQDKNDRLCQVGVRLSPIIWRSEIMGSFSALLEFVLGLPVSMKRLRLLEFSFCRSIVAEGLDQSDVLIWRSQLEKRGISLEGPNGQPLVEFLASLHNITVEDSFSCR